MTTDKSSSHISQRYDDELSGVKSQLFEMGGIVEKQVKDAIKSLLDVDSGIAEHVVKDDTRINDMEVAVDQFESELDELGAPWTPGRLPSWEAN